MIEHAIHTVGLDPTSTNVKLHETPACDKQLLDSDDDEPPWM